MSITESEHTPSVGFISLGCPKATVDSERIISQLRAEGYVISPDYQRSDVVVVNTCGFIDEAVEESLDAIAEAMEENGKVVVTGCLGARKSELQSRFPELVAVTGPQATEEVLEAVHSVSAPVHDPYVDLLPPGGIKLTPRHYAYVKISEGCNHKCTFCIIPSMRGRLVSRPAADVVAEAEALVGAGVRELLVVSQDTSAYGVDLGYQTSFHGMSPVRASMVDLSRALGSLGVWVRLHYVYPYPHVDELVPLMRDGLVLPYLDIPFQHASASVLKDMRRPAGGEKVLDRLKKWRDVCPELCIRSTFIVGFPGETEEDFDVLLSFLDKARLDRVGCFTYSPVEGARANALPGAVDEDIKQERLERFMVHQESISADKLGGMTGIRLDVLVDEVLEDGAVGRSYRDAPEIDGVVHITSDDPLQAGEIVTVTITSADQHDLFATV